MGFLAEADRQAGREFGARYWRLFVMIKFLRVAWPFLAAALVLGLGGTLAWRLVTAVGTHKPPSRVVWAVLGVAALVAVALIVHSAIQRMAGPPRRRRRFR